MRLAETLTAPTFGVEPKIFKEIKNIEFFFFAQRNFFSLKKSEAGGNSNLTSETDEHQSTDLVAGLSFDRIESFIFGGSLNFSLVDSYGFNSLTNTKVTSTVNYDASDTSSLTLFAKYKVDRESLLVLSLETVLNSSQTATLGTTKLNVSDIAGTALSVSWLQEF